mmetsp:Transcript_37915/g.78759  ORF Transcript_37915/g.78759 Transcript_37915/m.78759 type:complete len:390 (-) Transcript_37915:137-1306(-)
MECKLPVAWRDVELVSLGPSWKQFSMDLDVTLVQTLRLYSSDINQCRASLNTVAENLKRWKGQPSVVLIYASPSVKSPSNLVSEVLAELDGIDSSLVGLLYPNIENVERDDENLMVSQKTLVNMALDVVPTRWYLSGLDGGDTIISPDTIHLAKRKASLYQTMPGNIFVVPQFAFGSDEWWNVSELLEAKDSDSLEIPADVESCNEQEGEEDELSVQTTLLWWEQTSGLLYPDHKPSVPSALAKSLQDIEYKLTIRLGKESLDKFLSVPYTPLVLVDNLIKTGRTSEEGLHAHTLAREVEEFGGGRCFNLLRLSQLVSFGFQLNVLDGAFAASTPKSRKGGLHQVGLDVSPRCSGCFLLEGADDLRNQVFHQEVVRPIIARSLWEKGND